MTVYAHYSVSQDLSCLETRLCWSDNASYINEMLYEGYRDEGNPSKPIGAYPAAYDFSGTSPENFEVKVWYKDTFSDVTIGSPAFRQRVSGSLNMASQSLPALQGGSNSRTTFSISERIPKAGLSLHLDFASFLGPIFYMWVLGFMFPGDIDRASIREAVPSEDDDENARSRR